MVGTLITKCGCVTSRCTLDLTFDFAVVTLAIKSYPGYISNTVRCGNLICGRDISLECGCDLTFDLAVVCLTYKILSRLYLDNRKV